MAAPIAAFPEVAFATETTVSLRIFGERAKNLSHHELLSCLAFFLLLLSSLTQPSVPQLTQHGFLHIFGERAKNLSHRHWAPRPSSVARPAFSSN